MTYEEGIEWLRANGVVKNSETGELFQLGDDIPESAERHIVDTINRVGFLALLVWMCPFNCASI